MTVRLTEAFHELESDNRNHAIGEVAKLLAAFPVDHPVRNYADGCPKMLEAMRLAKVTPVTEAEAMKTVMAATGKETHDPEKHAPHNYSDKPRVSIEDIADRIRMAVRPARVDAVAARGALIVKRLEMAGARHRRPMRGMRPAGTY